MDPAGGLAAARQGDIDGFGGQAGIQLGLRQRGAAGVEQRFDLLLGLVDASAHFALLLGVQLAQCLEQDRQRAFLAQKARLGVFERGGVGGSGESFLSLRNQVVDQ